jgi:pimeloyl-ACP methyl ester carboxylesterase
VTDVPRTVVQFRTGDVTLVGDAFGDPADPPVVLLHGGGQTRHSWHGTASQLGSRGWYALSMDLRGHGDSGWSPDGNYSAEQYAKDLVDLSGQLPERPAFVGASLGGVSSLLAVGESDAPIGAALVMVDVAPRVEREGVERIRTFMRSGLHGFGSLDEAADAIAAYNPNRPRPKNLDGLRKNLRQKDDGRWYWHWDPRFMSPPGEPSGLDGISEARYTPEDRLIAAARRITVPALLVRGGSSDLLSEEGAKHLLSLIPHAQYVDVAGAGHMVAGDRNDRFNEAVVTFLDEEVKPAMRR